MSPEKALNILENIKRLTIQTQEGIVSNIEVQKTHPDRLKRAENFLQLAYQEVKSVREEDEIGARYWDEIADAFPIIISRLNDQMTLQQNMDFIQATDKKYLKEFLGYVMLYGEALFQEVLQEMEDSQFAKVEDVIDQARLDSHN